MSKRSIILFFILTSIAILSFGVYRIYEIFYSSYFNQVEYAQVAFLGNQEIPTKKEILFSGFKDLKIIPSSALISIIIIYVGKLFLHRK